MIQAVDAVTFEAVTSNLVRRIRELETREPRGVSAANLQTSIDNTSAGGGGRVYLGPGIHDVGTINMKSKVWLQGAGRGATLLRNLSVPSVSMLVATSVNDWGISDMTLQAATTSDFMQPLNVTNCLDATIENVKVVGGTHYGCCIQQGCRRIQMRNVVVTGQRKNPSFTTGGTGLWLFDDVADCVINNLDVYDCDGSGLILDAGTTGGAGIVVQRNTLSNFVLYDVGKGTAFGHGIEVEGAQYNSLANFVIDTVGNQGILLNVDQASIPSNHNTFTNGVLRNLQNLPLNIYGGVGNAFSNMQMRNFNINNAGSPYAMVLQESTTYGNQSPDDNVFENIVIDNSGGANYTYGVAIVAGTLHAYRNRFRNMSWGSPSTSNFITFDPEARVALNGPNGNMIEGRTGWPLGDNTHDAPMRFYGGDGPPSNAIGQDGDGYFQDFPRGANPTIYRKNAGAWVVII